MLESCPHRILNICIGKEGYPTIGYNFMHGHKRQALAVMPGAHVMINDKAIVRSNEAFEKVKSR